MLNVVAVNVGDRYPQEYTDKMRSMVARHLKREHTFHCIQDDPAFPAPPSWWHKCRAFKEIEGQVLYLDLDQVILKDIDPLLDACDPEKMTCYADHIEWFGSRFGSAFMYFPCGKFNRVYDTFMSDPETIMLEYDKRGGDQVFIGELIPEAQYLEDLMGYRPIMSYKFDDLDSVEPDEDTFIVNFHGNPKPHEVDHPWVLEHWK